ncbi:MAG: DEAD/DEAH box helicase [Fibrobacter sp.]|jgi:ATP-dependent DNA helicase DinG|nr:DEAD/DEAH box helicase [Fibrobacter sp.]
MKKIPDFVAVDLETTGLEFESDEIIEVALVRFVKGKPGDSLDFLVKPDRAELRPFIECLTGIAKADLDAAEGFADIAGKICEFIGDLPLVAHNAAFDSRFLKNSLKKVGIDYENHPFWDSLTFSRIAYQDAPNHRLDTLVQMLNIERSRAHRALPDADACGRLFVMAFEKISAMDPWLVDALKRVGEGSDWESVFGKAKGEWKAPQYKLPDVPAAAPLPQEKAPRVSEFFKENGFLSMFVENFVPREMQQDYASIVERNMYKGGICVLEAPTGSGKTLAYLVSAANKAVSGERVVISTATRALQEQLWKNELPQLMGIYNGKLIPAILKGRDNYLCLRKFEELSSSSSLLLGEELDSFMALIPWVLSTETGDINECASFSVGRNRVLWSKLASNASSCLGEKCPHYAKCPALAAKRRALGANLLLVNHSLFLADLALDFALLPPYEHIVFDEAHRLPAASNQSFGRAISFFTFRNIIKTLVPSRDGRGGLIESIKSRLPEASPATVEKLDQLTLSLNEMEKALHRLFMKLGKKIGKMKLSRSGLMFANGIQADYDVDPTSFLDAYAAVKSASDAAFADIRNEKSVDGLLNDAEGRLAEMDRYMADFEFIAKAGRKDWVCCLEEPFNPHTLKMYAYPLHFESVWTEKFYSWIKSATFTSATLAVQNSVEYFMHRMGMDRLASTKKPFYRVYSEQPVSSGRRSVYVTKYLPKPSAPEFVDAMNQTLVEVLPNVEENTMVLFTSVAAMLKAQAALAPAFASKNKLLLCQNVDGSLDSLVTMFRKERGACLLGCQSLWEGVDFPGDALKLLVITKLPFPNPSDPIVAGLSNEYKERGENPFKSYYVPEAYMEMRQGFGRLLRTEGDSGKVLILDNRVVTEHYGKTFQKIWNFKQKFLFSVNDVKKYI